MNFLSKLLLVVLSPLWATLLAVGLPLTIVGILIPAILGASIAKNNLKDLVKFTVDQTNSIDEE